MTDPGYYRCGTHPLFHRHAFCQVARFVDIVAERDREMVGEELQGDRGQHRHNDVVGLGHDDDIVDDSLQLSGPALGRDRGNDSGHDRRG